MAIALARAGANVVILARDPSRAGELKERLEGGPGNGTLVHADVLVKASACEGCEGDPGPLRPGSRPDQRRRRQCPRSDNQPTPAFLDLPEDAIKTGGGPQPARHHRSLPSVRPHDGGGRGRGTSSTSRPWPALRPLTRTIAYRRRQGGASAILLSGWRFTWRRNTPRESGSTPSRPDSFTPGKTTSCFTTRRPVTHTARPVHHGPHPHAVGRGVPKDLLGALFWLLSPGADFVTGTVVVVDGGFSAFSGV